MKQDKTRLRNLKQYKNLTDEEFEDLWEDYRSQPDLDIETRIEQAMEELAKNYDLRDMNVNDTLSLRELSRIFVQLDDLGKIEQDMISNGSVAQLKILSSIKKEYLDSASRLQNDLNITRKSRQSDTGESLDAYLPSILKKAKNFLNQRLAYIYCPECRMLVGNTWFAEWSGDNELHLTCPREECRHKFIVTSDYLAKNRNRNLQGTLQV